MKIELLSEAERDLTDGFHFYEKLCPGVGFYFLESLASEIDSLALYAGIHETRFGFYRLLARRFPYAVYYRMPEPERVQILAVLDCRRSPEMARTRLRPD
ncbi:MULTISPECIES: type II toxin-antitoxin system RelE/ParE family toxin [unclassified Thioalkalivibrio]|uniref:type II toxin-antitoxin system RelE/ParE family toxin n=1 Tax=unclassified Thioalkalivibrio TaxID=2621013 RepID=UPI00037B0FFF|nr:MULTISPECIES: type II toxin-antitoxin system RelE/ParE family toxin [unclassified Thioalkalivibrio]